MDVKKVDLPCAVGKQNIHNMLKRHTNLNLDEKKFSTSYTAEELVELLSRLPAFAPKPVCKFIINDRTLFGKLEHKKESSLFIRHKFGKKVVQYHMKQLQSVDILKY
ncbi:hypothetical protein QUF81_22035 [Peribacillus simplex]|jgi:hypothetical protein|uniref:Uncharacterized protein n=1 Tax=Peribacillus simplex TaxID=1478 RepID=A0AAW7IKA6_9BACI|nr:hypothetical protein [Peribacillus simplex]SNT58349.1 hypothetical protein SAMN05444672_1695 [Bacillus sp. OK838]AMM92164.1 hypothetical protein UP17_06095 [Peribacillus simplex]MDF9762775.1 hypothetical protein [Peribacillus simplex]MDM5295793.1 hypothetical protein [Peribacillus simplex]MDM5454799.1 hypothetical protein [Peribacillus simplex]